MKRREYYFYSHTSINYETPLELVTDAFYLEKEPEFDDFRSLKKEKDF